MNYLKTTLWISAIGFLLAAPFIVLPWGIVENIFLMFGAGAISGEPITVYLFRIICGMAVLMGLFFVMLARNPLQYVPLVKLGGYGLMLFGLFSLLAGLSSTMPLKLYIGDVLFGLVFGVIIILLVAKVSKPEGKITFPVQ